MKFMQNDNSKSMQANSVLVIADRVAGGMKFVKPVFPATGSLSIGAKRTTRWLNQPTSTGESYLSHASSSLANDLPGDHQDLTTTTNFRVRDLWQETVERRTEKLGDKQPIINGIRQNGLSNLPVGKQRFLQCSHDGQYGEVTCLRNASSPSSSSQISLGISL